MFTDAAQSIGKCQLRQTGARLKCSGTDLCDTLRNGQLRQTGAAFKCALTDHLKAAGQSELRQTGTAAECCGVDGLDRIRQCDRGELCAVSEIPRTDLCTACNGHRRQSLRERAVEQVCEGAGRPLLRALRCAGKGKGDRCQCRSAVQDIRPDLLHIGGDDDLCQTGIILECTRTDAFERIRQLHSGQGFVRAEGIAADLLKLRREGDTAEHITAAERIAPDQCHMFRDGHGCQGIAVLERFIADRFERFRQYDLCQILAGGKIPCGDLTVSGHNDSRQCRRNTSAEQCTKDGGLLRLLRVR